MASNSRREAQAAATQKARENRMRGMADRRGLRLVKSGRRDKGALDYGKYMLVDQLTGSAVAGVSELGRAELSLDEIEQYLTRER